MATATTSKKATEPKFSTLAAELASADAEARSTSDEAKQAKLKRNDTAVRAILAAHSEKIPIPDVRTQLLAGGVLKGTVSKIATILEALNDGILTRKDVKTLNGSYVTVKAARAAAIAAALGPIPAATPAPTASSIATPDDAVSLILDTIRAAGDPDAVFKAAGDWITRLTNEITALTRAVGGGDDDE